MDTLLGILIGMGSFIVLILIVRAIINANKKGEKAELTWVKEYVAPIALYILGLWLIYLKCNPLWVAWHNPEELFWITNAMILIIAIWRRGFLWIVVGIMGGILFIFIIRGMIPDKNKEVEVLMQEGYTPLTVDIRYKFRFYTDGKPINVKFNGIEEIVPFAGVGDFNAPTNLRSGETVINSRDPNNPRIWVRVFKITKN